MTLPVLAYLERAEKALRDYALKHGYPPETFVLLYKLSGYRLGSPEYRGTDRRLRRQLKGAYEDCCQKVHGILDRVKRVSGVVEIKYVIFETRFESKTDFCYNKPVKNADKKERKTYKMRLENLLDSGVKDIYYAGTEAQWKAIEIGRFNGALTNAVIHYNSVDFIDVPAGAN